MLERDEPLRDIGRLAEGWFAHQVKAMGAIERSKRLIKSSLALLAEWRGVDQGGAGGNAGVDRRKELTMTEDHVRRAEELVAQQREVVARLSAAGLATDVATTLLEKLEISRANLLEHLQLVRREIVEEEHRVR